MVRLPDFFAFLEQSLMLIGALGKHKGRTGGDFNTAGGLAVTIHLAQETEIDPGAAN